MVVQQWLYNFTTVAEGRRVSVNYVIAGVNSKDSVQMSTECMDVMRLVLVVCTECMRLVLVVCTECMDVMRLVLVVCTECMDG